ncbi:hypothetical protein L6164_006455 [Bauhinia variegata]|uniref:Uncharacterized protein n=1 Tax=Bauhinia variegata TaxID=167791 RepID=A0ACB9PVX1_BAUVA|nr:hypothetical protein L6164_006455 [Bauhinia variegata]
MTESDSPLMVLWSYPPTPRQLAVTGVFFVSGVSFFTAGAYLSFVNIAPQQERVKARKEAIKNSLRKLIGD